MPTRAIWLASVPKCDRLRGPLSARGPCGKPMRWVHLREYEGKWCCPAHGPMLNGYEAALRAGYISVARVDTSEAA